jgi:carboxypeptidase Taq
MLWERLEADVPGVSASLERGELASVTGWLREHVHAHGARESAAGAISRITGQTLGAESFLRHVQRRYA